MFISFLFSVSEHLISSYLIHETTALNTYNYLALLRYEYGAVQFFVNETIYFQNVNSPHKIKCSEVLNKKEMNKIASPSNEIWIFKKVHEIKVITSSNFLHYNPLQMKDILGLPTFQHRVGDKISRKTMAEMAGIYELSSI